MIDVDTKLLRSFLAVSGEGSFSKAADWLGCSQATMSLRIKMLERQVGAVLFERGYHRVTLTQVGRDLLPQARAIIDLHDRMIDQLRHQKVAGSVRLGIAEDYAVPMLPQLLTRLRKTYEAIELNIVCELSARLRQRIDARSLDIAIVTTEEPVPGATILAEPKLQWVAAPDFVLPERQDLPIAFYPEGCAFRKAATATLAKNGVRYREALSSVSGQVIQSAVVSGLSVTIMADGTIPPGLRVLTAGLPPLPKTCIQILRRAGAIPEAVKLVSMQIARLYGHQ
ncbi:LysR family transcriptional regulator [Oricola nitratireducens]|uniref:LysR family transcriptional regulator n=1 Tax=Oricola nitratireducens TaxID=2775868 RepID=UPI0018694890|nr:LysR family transcriptional regulator [Oricola nitratireducens]